MHMTLNATQAAYLLMADKNANWSYNGALALVEYLQEYEDSTGEEIAFNVVDVRCEWSEYESGREAADQTLGSDWAVALDDEADEEEVEEAAWVALSDRTVVITFKGGVIIHDF